MKTATVLVLLGLAAMVAGDVYLHNPRGSNNRLDEQTRDRNNDNRLFDSQNNDKGSYNQNDMTYYGGSELWVEWTNQHGCGDDSWNNCQIVMQYMCEEPTGTGLRDGQTRTTIDSAAPNKYDQGRHEDVHHYNNCTVRERNMGLFLADRTPGNNQNYATYTRQNTNNNVYGFECPEERDYYPYWHPTPWVDIAVITNDYDVLAPYYRAESQNVMNKGYCTGIKAPDPADPNKILSGGYYNNQAACEGDAFEWVVGWKHNVAPPEVLNANEVAWSRVNHLGNGRNGQPNQYKWILPNFGSEKVCVFRLRYNISDDDYDGWNTFADQNGINSPITDDPEVTLGGTPPVVLKLAYSTDQHFRTFQDRSHTFRIAPKPVDGRIVNLNVRGSRGNIVQNFPSVEYDYVPTTLEVTTADWIHRQVTGSNTTPNGNGQGRDGTDRHNFIQIYNRKTNYPLSLSDITMIPNPTSNAGYEAVKHWALLGQNDDELDDATPHQDFGLMRYSFTTGVPGAADGVTDGSPPGARSDSGIHYMNTRQNNFTNRSQKGTIVVRAAGSNEKEKGWFGLTKSAGYAAGAGVAVGGILVIAAVGVLIFGALNADSKIGGAIRSIIPSRGYSAPAGYA